MHNVPASPKERGRASLNALMLVGCRLDLPDWPGKPFGWAAAGVGGQHWLAFGLAFGERVVLLCGSFLVYR